MLTFGLLFWMVVGGCSVDPRSMARMKRSRKRVARREMNFMVTTECEVDRDLGYSGV